MKAQCDLVTNAEALTSIFGHWPSFHDSEVLSFLMERIEPGGPCIEMVLQVWELSDEEDDRGYYIRQNEVRARIRCTGVQNVALAEFNEQNVLGELTIENAGAGVKVTLWPCYGLNGSFVCESIEIMEAVPVAKDPPQ